jgi:hypothetical protein
VRKLQDSIQRESLPESCKSLSLRIAMPLTNVSNVARGKDIVNRSARLLHDLINSNYIEVIH